MPTIDSYVVGERRRGRRRLAVIVAGALLLAPICSLAAQGTRARAAQVTRSTFTGHVRVYYIAADEVDWTFIPARADQALTGAKDDFGAFPGSKGTLDPNSTTYRKALYREYTDSSFRTLKPRGDTWAHLGVLGPVIRGEVGDTIKIVFRNHAKRPYSMHPHGVFYRKNSEGLAYLDGTSGADRMDDSVPPGGTHLYVWPVPERAGPAHGDGSSVLWTYHSHVDEGRTRTLACSDPSSSRVAGWRGPTGRPRTWIASSSRSTDCSTRR